MKKHSAIHLVAVLIIIAYLSPALILGEASHVMIHDHLDGPFVRTKLLAESGMMFGALDATIDNIMNGAPIATLGSSLNITLWLFYFLDPFGAYVVNQFLIRVVAYFGVYLLLKRYVLKEESDWPALVGTSIAFALLPFYAMFGLTVAGQPLALYAFLNIRKSCGDWKDWLIIATVPFYSLFVLSYIFFIGIIGLLWLYDLVNQRKANIAFAVAIMLMTSLFILVDYRLVFALLSPEYGFVSHRTEFQFASNNLITNLKEALNNFIYGQGHAVSLHYKIVLPTIALAAFVALWQKVKTRLLWLLLGLIMLISLWYGLWFSAWEFIHLTLPNLPYFNMGRFNFLHPLLWYVAFGIAISILWKHLPKIGKPLGIFLIALQIAFLFNRSDNRVEKNLSAPSFGEFYSQALFSDIAVYINKDKSSYRVCSLGIHPGIALYNGFYTLDGQLPNYPVKYKHQFRKIIEKELAGNEIYRKYFDEWGTRFYVFSGELEPLKSEAFLLTKSKVELYHAQVRHLQFNTEEFKKMGGRYLFSALEIQNAKDIGLQLLKVFERNDSPWRIYVYSAQK